MFLSIVFTAEANLEYFGRPLRVILSCRVVNTGWEMDIRNEQGSSEWGHEGQ